LGLLSFLSDGPLGQSFLQILMNAPGITFPWFRFSIPVLLLLFSIPFEVFSCTTAVLRKFFFPLSSASFGFLAPGPLPLFFPHCGVFLTGRCFVDPIFGFCIFRRPPPGPTPPGRFFAPCSIGQIGRFDEFGCVLRFPVTWSLFEPFHGKTHFSCNVWLGTARFGLGLPPPVFFFFFNSTLVPDSVGQLPQICAGPRVALVPP